MGKQMLKKAGAAATESVLRDLMPFIDERFGSLQAELREMSGKMLAVEERFSAGVDRVEQRLDTRGESMREEMTRRFDSQLDAINEVSHRITKLEGRIEGVMEPSGNVFGPEPIKVARRRKAG